MFFPRKGPPAIRPETLHGIRFSLNTPVIQSRGVPSGPARAAIAVHAADSSGRALTVAIRSLRTSTVTVLGFDGDLDSSDGLFHAIEAALTYCETMGFLFDEDEIEVGEPGVEKPALQRWEALVGSVEGDAAEDGPAEDEAPSPLPERLGAAEAGPAGADRDPARRADVEGSSPSPAAPDKSPPDPSLSKFRMRPPSPPAAEPADLPPSALGRIPLKKRRASESAGERPSFLLRILSGF
ncbi:MAG: hypothetical protein JSU66_14430 [Deltaproteobacteria bacterium]|nr:MAG: hypothetical protein JSU66_14430 [Deltaproteobacteria bacterium]